MARWKEFIIALEYENDEFISLSELQSEFDSAISNEDYKAAAKIKEMIDERVNGDEEEESYKAIDEACFVDLDEVAAFYQAEFHDHGKFTKVILKNGAELPLSIGIEDFKKLFFS